MAFPAFHVSARRVQAHASSDVMSSSPAYPRHLVSAQGDDLIIPRFGVPVTVKFSFHSATALGGRSSWTIRSRTGILAANYAARLGAALSLGAFVSGTNGMLHPVAIFEILDFQLTIGYISDAVVEADDARLFAQFPLVDLLVTDNRCSVSESSSGRLIHAVFARVLRGEVAKFKDWPSL